MDEEREHEGSASGTRDEAQGSKDLTAEEIGLILHCFCHGGILEHENVTISQRLTDKLKSRLKSITDVQTSPPVNTHGEGHERLHEWFGLSYANYLTIPRTVLQSMPDDWQERMADLLEEMSIVARQHNLVWPGHTTKIEVRLRKGGHYIRDPLADYERGRRRIF